MELRLYQVKPTVIHNEVEIPADDTKTLVDKKTGKTKRDPQTQQPIVEALGTKSVQYGDSVRVEYPYLPRMAVTLIYDFGEDGVLWIVDAPRNVHETLVRDTRVSWLTWNEANEKLPTLSEWVLPGDIIEPKKS